MWYEPVKTFQGHPVYQTIKKYKLKVILKYTAKKIKGCNNIMINVVNTAILNINIKYLHTC